MAFYRDGFISRDSDPARRGGSVWRTKSVDKVVRGERTARTSGKFRSFQSESREKRDEFAFNRDRFRVFSVTLSYGKRDSLKNFAINRILVPRNASLLHQFSLGRTRA